MMEPRTVPLSQFKALRIRFLVLALQAARTKDPGRYHSQGNPAMADALREVAASQPLTVVKDQGNTVILINPDARPKKQSRKRSASKGKAAMKSAAAAKPEMGG